MFKKTQWENEKKETNLPSRGGRMEKRREDGFAVILVKLQVAQPGEGLEGERGGGTRGINRLVLHSRTRRPLGDRGRWD